MGAFTAAQAVAAGHDVDAIRSELGRHRWVRLRKGVSTTAACLAEGDDAAVHLRASVAVLLSLDPGPVLSHASAARVHGLVVPSSAGDGVRLTDREQWRRGRGYRVSRARLGADDVRPWLTGR